MESVLIEKKLYDASLRGDTGLLNQLLREDEFAVQNYANSNNQTLLHLAAARGHVDFAKVLLEHKHDLVNELDSRLRSPLHLTCANGRVEMVKLLLLENSDVCLMEDEFGRTPLHLAAMNGQVEIVNKLVRARPEAVMYPLNKTRTVQILHSYVISKGPNALEPLVEVDRSFLNSQDEKGDTILHKVVALRKLETLKYLISKELDVHLKNHNKITAMDLIDQMPKDSETTDIRVLLANYKSQKNKEIKAKNTNRSSTGDESITNTNKYTWLESKRNGMLVGATVIASMAYQASLNPPGGVWEDDKTYINYENKNITVLAGTSVMAANYPELYTLFWTSNTISFVAALSMVLLLIRGSNRRQLNNTSNFCVNMTRLYMWFLTGVVWIMTTAMALTYACAMVIIAPEDGIPLDSTGTIVAIAVIAWVVLTFIVLILNLCRFLICVCVKLVKCAIRSSIWKKSNPNERQIQSQDTATTCCLSV